AEHLAQAGHPVSCGQAPESAVGRHGSEVAQRDVAVAVALALPREHGVRSRLDSAVNRAREVDAEEREGRIGNRVHQVPDQADALRSQLVALAAEGDDVQPWADAAELGDAIGAQPGAVDQRAARDRAAVRLDDDLTAGAAHVLDASAEHELTTRSPHLAGEHLDDARIVDDPGLRNVEAGNAGHVRLKLADLLGAEPAHAVQPVGAPAPLELIERWQLGRPRGDDQLAAALVRHAVLLAQPVHEVATLHAVPRLQRPRLVVQPRVDHAAVVAALVGGELRLGLEHHERAAQPLAEGVGGGNAEDAAADDGDVVPGRLTHPATSGGGVSCSTNQRSTSSGVMMPTSLPARVTGRLWMRWARSMAITSSAGANSSMEIVG